jgi:hypothetical protein
VTCPACDALIDAADEPVCAACRARGLVQESAVVWRRDWDALAVGFVVGLLVGLAWR